MEKSSSHQVAYSSHIQDDLLAELEELEQEELESDLLEVGEPSKPLDIGDPLDELPEVRKYTDYY